MSKVSFKWNKPVDTIINDKVKNKPTLMFTASMARKFMNDYVPRRDGHLREKVKVTVEGDHGLVTYVSPYAARQYHGVSFKHTTKGTAAYWDKAMLQARRGDLVQSVQAYIKKRGG